MGSHLDIDFLPIFFDFGGQNGGKLGGKIEPRAIKDRYSDTHVNTCCGLRLKIDSKRHPKNDEKKRASWRVLGGDIQGSGRSPDGRRRNPGPPKAPKSKKITKTLKLKLIVNSRSMTRTPLHACAQARWRIFSWMFINVH